MLGKRVGELRARCRRHHSVACSVRQKSHRIRSQVSKWSATMRCLLSGRAAIIKTSTLAHYSRPMCYPRGLRQTDLLQRLPFNLHLLHTPPCHVSADRPLHEKFIAGRD
ncbi:hypothetical protein JG687_00002694 [Phytophthora cactorum]|uniref:Uncharacterized protein n=1 Tax=Phytophthora cactorum TaxID=29920 RepID=A0A8T1UXP5_9STRA|nr:hypothetical protein JG687_00002694 [Phytophthora cactorum]